MKGDPGKLYCARSEERLVQEYNQLQPMDPSKTYRVPCMQHAGNKESQPTRLSVFMFEPKRKF
jgi:hypothetical protein